MTYAIGPDMWTPRNDAVALSRRWGGAAQTAASHTAGAVNGCADYMVRAGVARHGVLLVGGDDMPAAGEAAMPRVSGGLALASGEEKKGFGAMLARACVAIRDFLNAPMC